MNTVATRYEDNDGYIPSDKNTINVILFCDIREPKEYDFVIFWLSRVNQSSIKNNTKYNINFDYETNINMTQNKYNLLSTPTIRFIHQDYCIEYNKINSNDFTFDKLILDIKNAINELILTYELHSN